MSTHVVDQADVVDGVRLADCDRGQGSPVVCVHGTPAHAVIWRNVLPGVQAAGYRTVAYAHQLAAAIPDAELAAVDDAGHFITEDDSTSVVHEVTSFSSERSRYW